MIGKSGGQMLRDKSVYTLHPSPPKCLDLTALTVAAGKNESSFTNFTISEYVAKFRSNLVLLVYPVHHVVDASH